jgi:ketosteroid isomerase-like protein
MSREDVERARRVFDLFNERDLAAFFDSFHPDVTYRNREDEPDVRTYRGIAEYREYVRGWLEMFDDLRLEDLVVDDVRDSVIAAATLCGRGRDTGAEVRGRYVFLLRFRDGLILDGREYGTTDEALEAVGARES